MPVCSHCAAPVNPTHMFCNNCGNPLELSDAAAQQSTPAQPPPSFPAVPEPQGEPIVGVIPQCKYGVPVNTFALFLTDRRIIAAKTAGLFSNFTAGSPGRGRYGGGLSPALTKKIGEYFSMPREQMLSKDKKNFELPYASVQRVKTAWPGTFRQGKINFLVAGTEVSFLLDTTREEFRPHILALQLALPGKVIVE